MILHGQGRLMLQSFFQRRMLSIPDVVLPLYLGASLVLGGASAAGALANAILQLTAVAILCCAVAHPSLTRAASVPRTARILLACLIILMAVQFAPMPPEIWTALPGRAFIAQNYGLMGQPLPWLPLSLGTERSAGSALALLPFLAALLLGLGTNGKGRENCTIVLIAFSLFSIGLGTFQRFGGASSAAWYPYTITNHGGAVGLFANRNHLATLLLMTFPFTAALAASLEARAGDDKRIAGLRRLFGGVVVLLILGVFVVRSSAGLALLGPALWLSFVVYWKALDRRLPRSFLPLSLCFFACLVLFLLFGPFQDRFLDKALSTQYPVTRRTSMATTLRAARDFFPWGSGIGSFVHIYAGYEDPSLVGNEFVNHAHNDWLEVLLEIGLPGLLLLTSFSGWILFRARRMFVTSGTDDVMAKAAIVAVILVVAHSLVDYPARTAAILSIAGMAIAFACVPCPAATEAERRNRTIRAA